VNVQPKLANEFQRVQPYATGVPSNLASFVEDYVLASRRDVALGRIDALKALVDEWEELADANKHFPPDVPERERGPMVAVRMENGGLRLTSREDTEPRSRIVATIPQRLLKMLADRLSSVDTSQGLVLLGDLSYLLGRWEELVIDMEKLVGHLILAHDIRDLDAMLGSSHAKLVATHSRLHRRIG
jgi:hypothetical protein